MSGWAYKARRGRPRKSRQGRPVAEAHIPFVAKRAADLDAAVRTAGARVAKDQRDPMALAGLIFACLDKSEVTELVDQLETYIQKDQR